MRVGNYSVNWIYAKAYNRKHDRDVEQTTCKIINIENEKVVSQESIQRYHTDAHCLDKARKYSLRKALLVSFPDPREREAFYNAYRLMTQEKPRWYTKEEKVQMKEQKKAERVAH